MSHATKGLTRYGTNDRISRDYGEFGITAAKPKLPADVHNMLPAMCDNFSGSESYTSVERGLTDRGFYRRHPLDAELNLLLSACRYTSSR